MCAFWRRIASNDASIILGLPLVAGGAVSAALAATIAREQQRVREEVATGQSIDFLVGVSAVVDLPEWQRIVIQQAVQSILARSR